MAKKGVKWNKLEMWGDRREKIAAGVGKFRKREASSGLYKILSNCVYT